MQLVHGIAELRAQLSAWRRQGERIAFVPTMGNLHRGHLELVRQGRSRAPRVVSSVFVNPLQFGPNEDFDRYPRTLEQDRERLEGEGCDLLFAPSVREIYPRGREGLTVVSVPGISEILCGAFRPGHFDGVATVVNVLFNLVQPDLALFGQKDYQQLYLIRRMAADLHLPVEVVGVATERESDGLALSSRNQYLSPEERVRAPALFAGLQAIADGLRSGRRDFTQLAAGQVAILDEKGFKSQYLEIRRPDLSEPAETDREFVILAAAYLGKTRLIDNLHIDMTVI